MDRNWNAVEREVGSGMMPLRLDGKMEEYGCGGYGCVLPVSPGKVMKITTDASEAAFVGAASSRGDWPPGITPYYAVLAIPEEYEEKPVFLLWREEAYNVGALAEGASRRDYYDEMLGYRTVEVFIDYLLEFRSIADSMHQQFRYKGHATRSQKEMVRLASEVQLLGAQAQLLPNREQNVDAEDARFLVEMTKGLDKVAGEIAEAMTFGASVGFALQFYARRGLVLADVHLGNVGEIRDPDSTEGWDLAIIDPGVMLPLDPRWMRVNIPRI